MNCIVTAGPTYEPLDQVRRLTNFSTGRLGSELVNFLADKGHQVTLLIGQQATWRGERHPANAMTFTTTNDLRQKLESLAGSETHAVFHAAAVSDFTFGKIWKRTADGGLVEFKSGKISTREQGLLTELVPTPKILASLRNWFPQATIVGWKYEVDGDRDSVLHMAEQQISTNRTNACVANGPAYGVGFGLVTGLGDHLNLRDHHKLFEALEILASPQRRVCS